ncbi:histidinol-phosphatase [Chitinispirillales bacterium ANBcel5]|uniref:histidinol-phosphatase n=1 Tax=Cellulosispirillum alkaliphilum TaxID=3039283 RepID=UPI002A5622B8|nr:histidinol-phosphatase [Chitinispirillales bacterium ANBcel5]
MLADYHIHTPYCRHAFGKIVDYIEKAISLGFDEIGFSDHLGRYYLSRSQKKRNWDWGMNNRDLALYFDELSTLKEAYSDRITIRIGLEVDYIKGAEELASEILSLYPLDYTICSVHCLPHFGLKHLAQYKKVDPLSIYLEYFDAAREALKCGLFQSLAHLDFIWRYIPWPEGSEALIFKEIQKTVETASQNESTKLEINSNGYLWSNKSKIRDYDPFIVMIEEIAKRDVTITIGSDAHEPVWVGKAFDSILSLLIKKGVKNFCCFDKKRAIIHPLQPPDKSN